MAEETSNENEINESQNEVSEPETSESTPAVSVEVEEREEGIKRKYAITFILNSSMSASETDSVRENLNKRITAHQGNIATSICQESPKRLAYAIGKENQGYFCEAVFEAESTKIIDIEREFKNEPNILRYMLEVKPAPSTKRPKKRISPYGAPVAGIGKEESSLPKTDEREKISVEEIEKKIDEIIDNI